MPPPRSQEPTVRRRAAGAYAVLGALCFALVLSGCTPSSAPATSTSPGESSTKPKPKPSPSPTVTVEPVLVVAAVDVDGRHVTASGYVQGVIEDGGSCVFTFTKDGSAPVTVENTGTADRSSTACGAVQPEIGEFVRGSWTVTLTYTSPTGTFHSQPQIVEVP